MAQFFIHETDRGNVAVGTATQEALQTHTLEQIALKDTPEGKPFWIVEDSVFPSDVTFFDAWVLDTDSLGDPAGYGMDYDTWVQEYRQ